MMCVADEDGVKWCNYCFKKIDEAAHEQMHLENVQPGNVKCLECNKELSKDAVYHHAASHTSECDFL